MRIIKNGDGFELVQVSKDEKKTILNKLAVWNRRIMRRCIKDAIGLAEKAGWEPSPTATAMVACSLFDKLGTASFTVLKDAETARTFHEKELANAKIEYPKYRAME